MRLKRETLLLKLHQVSPGLATREILEQSASFVFSEGKIITFNDEILCEADYDCKFTGAVHARPLVDLLSKMADDEIDITAGEGQLIVTGKEDKAEITMNAEVLLPTESVEEAKNWKPLHAEFNQAIEVVQGSASQDDVEFNLTCVHLTPIHVEACDGYQMTRFKIDTGLTSNCLIKRDSAKNLTGLGMSHVSEGKNWIHFKSADLRVSCRRWVQEYINLDELVNFTGKKTTLPGGLAEAVAKAEIFSQHNANENLVLVQMKEGKLRIIGEGAHGKITTRKKIAYDGELISFMIPPKLLVEITRRTNDVSITAERLKIDAGKFVFVATLGAVAE